MKFEIGKNKIEIHIFAKKKIKMGAELSAVGFSSYEML